MIVDGGEHAITRHVAADDGAGDEAFAHELTQIVWYGAFRRPAG